MQLPTLPADAEPLAESGFFALSSDLMSNGIQFQLARVSDSGAITAFPVADVLNPRSQFGPPAQMRHTVQVYQPKRDHYSAPFSMGVRATRAYTEVVNMAAELASIFDEGVENLIAQYEESQRKREAEREEWRKQEEERRAIRLQQQREREAKMEARAKHLYEIVRWMLGDTIRLTRDGYRSTVFGTIDRVSEPQTHSFGKELEEPRYHNIYMYITTERGQPMHILLRDINKLDTKHEGDRRYTNLYNQTAKKEVTQ